MNRPVGAATRAEAPSSVFALLEQAVAQAATEQPLLLAARATWDRLAGVVYDDESLWEERAAAFLEWYLIDFQATDGRTPIAAQIAEADERTRQRLRLRAIATSHRSLFRVRADSARDLLLDDLWGGAQFRVRERRRAGGFSVGELFEARLIADVDAPPDLLFGRTLCFHPREAEGAIRHRIEQARQAGESRATLLFRLLRLRVRCERYRHVPHARIYATDEPEA